MQKFYEPEIRALLGTASRFCEAVVLELGTAPNDLTLGLRILQVVRRGAHATYNQFEEKKQCIGLSLVDHFTCVLLE